MHPRVQRLLDTHPAPWSLRRIAEEHLDFAVVDSRGQIVASYGHLYESFAAACVEAVNQHALDGPFLADVRQHVLAARQVGIESSADAIAKDMPF